MSQIARYVEAPYNGVSEAPPQVRPDNAAEAVEDTYLAVPQGASKRPPFSWQGRLQGHPGVFTGAFELIEREGSDDAFLTLTSEGGQVIPRLYLAAAFPRGYEPDGKPPEPIVIDAAAQAYLNAGNPDPVSDLVVVTVEDYTFVLNRRRIVQKSSTLAPTRNKEALVWVRQAAYARVFTVTVSPTGGTPVTASLRTPNGKDATDARFVDTEVIAGALISGSYTAVNEATVTGDLTSLTSQGFTVTQVGPVIYFQAPVGVDFTVDVADGQGGFAMVAIKDKAQRFADLPARAVAGFVLRITQQSGSDVDDFFVRYEAAAGTGSGVWVETIGPGAEVGLDPATMPVGLVYDAGWRLKVLDWKQRLVGDQLLAPDPDFVGSTIQDIGFWRGRLAITSGQEEMLSSADDPLRFYPETLSTITDADPIALVSPLPGKGTFTRAVPFDSRLIVFADKGQAAVQASGVLTVNTGSIDVAGAYEYSGPLRPLAVGERLYFLAPRSTGASVVYELVGGQDSEGKYRLTGDDNTAVAPSYVPSGIDRAACSGVNYTVVYARSGDRAMYAHLFRYAEREKVQNAWSRWWLPEGWAIGGLIFSNTRLYVLAVRDGEAHLVMADFAPAQKDPLSARLLTHLNFRLTQAQLLVTDLGETTRISAPYPLNFGAIEVVVRAPAGGDSFPEGLLMTPTASVDTRTFDMAEDLLGVPLWVGERYVQRVDLSTFYALGSDNRPLRSGRLSVRRVVVDVSNTGYLRSETTIGARPVKIAEFTGLTYDSPLSLFDVVPRATGKLSFGVGGENESTRIALVNDTPFPSSIIGLEWRGELTLKAGRA